MCVVVCAARLPHLQTCAARRQCFIRGDSAFPPIEELPEMNSPIRRQSRAVAGASVFFRILFAALSTLHLAVLAGGWSRPSVGWLAVICLPLNFGASRITPLSFCSNSGPPRFGAVFHRGLTRCR